jgi:hypothetical protein
MISLIESRKGELDAARNVREFASRDFPSIKSLVNPSTEEVDTPVASAVAKHLVGIVRVHTLPEKIAVSDLDHTACSKVLTARSCCM